MGLPNTHTKHITFPFYSMTMSNTMHSLPADLFQGSVKFQWMCIVPTAKIRLGHTVVTSTNKKNDHICLRHMDIQIFVISNSWTHTLKWQFFYIHLVQAQKCCYLIDESSLTNNLNCSYPDSDYWLTKKLTWKKMTRHKQKKGELNSSDDIS